MAHKTKDLKAAGSPWASTVLGPVQMPLERPSPFKPRRPDRVYTPAPGSPRKSLLQIALIKGCSSNGDQVPSQSYSAGS